MHYVFSILIVYFVLCTMRYVHVYVYGVCNMYMYYYVLCSYTCKCIMYMYYVQYMYYVLYDQRASNWYGAGKDSTCS